MSDIKKFGEWEKLGMAIEKLNVESNNAYQGFLAYAWLQGTERTIANASKRIGFDENTMREWSMTYNWQERAANADASRWLYEFKQREKLMEADNRRYVAENRKIKDGLLEASQKMLVLVNKLLVKAEQADEVIQNDWVETKDGQMVPTYTEIKMHSKVSDIPRMMDTVAKTIRSINDLPTEVLDKAVPVDLNLAELSVEELIELRNKNRGEMLALSGVQKLESVS